MKFQVILSDNPWNFSDPLSMTSTKRGASSNYDTLSVQELKDLPVKEIAEDDAILVLWVPSSLLKEGLEVMEAWGFRQTQTVIWVKTKKKPIISLLKETTRALNLNYSAIGIKPITSLVKNIFEEFSLQNTLAFGLGRLFRQTHEIALVGVKGKIYNHLLNKSQRSVFFAPVTKHSAKPDILHDMLDKMFSGNKLEMFARRDRPGYVCVGLECPGTLGEDIRDSLERLQKE